MLRQPQKRCRGPHPSKESGLGRLAPTGTAGPCSLRPINVWSMLPICHTRPAPARMRARLLSRKKGRDLRLPATLPASPHCSVSASRRFLPACGGIRRTSRCQSQSGKRRCRARGQRASSLFYKLPPRNFLAFCCNAPYVPPRRSAAGQIPRCSSGSVRPAFQRIGLPERAIADIR